MDDLIVRIQRWLKNSSFHLRWHIYRLEQRIDSLMCAWYDAEHWAKALEAWHDELQAENASLRLENAYLRD